MLRSLLSKRWSPIAVDLGAASLRAVQLRGGGAAPVVHEAVAVERRPSTADDEAPDFSDRIAQLGQLIDRHGFRGRSIALALDPPTVELRPVNLPSALLDGPSREIIAAIRWEVGRVLSFPPEQAEFAYWALPPGRGGSAPRQTTMAVSADRQRLTAMTDACRKHGLACTRIDAGPCALVAAGLTGVQPQPNDIWGILDLGAAANKLTVAVGQIPVYQRLVPGAGTELTERLARVLEVPVEAAENLKRRWGIQATTRGHRMGPCDLQELRDEDVPEFLFSIVRPLLDVMQREIERAFGYVMQTYPEATPKRLVLAGLGARLRGLASWLTEALGVPVASLDGLATEKSRWKRFGVDELGMMRAFGLARLALERS